MNGWPYSWPGTEGLDWDAAVWTALRAADQVQHPDATDPFPRQTLEEWCARMAASRAADEARYLRDCRREERLLAFHHTVQAELRHWARVIDQATHEPLHAPQVPRVTVPRIDIPRL